MLTEVARQALTATKAPTVNPEVGAAEDTEATQLFKMQSTT